MKYLVAASPKPGERLRSFASAIQSTAMHLIANGLVRVGNQKGSGKLLITDRSLFVFKDTGNQTTGIAIGGLVGALVMQMLDKRKAAKNPPAHLQDPEIAALKQSDRGKLAVTALLAKLPVSQKLSIQTTRLGFDISDGATAVNYKGWFQKRNIINFLESLGLRVNSI